MGRVSLLVALGTLTACSEQRLCSPADARKQCEAEPADPTCRWSELLENRASAQTLSLVLSGVSGRDDLDAGLRALFPALEGKRLVDDAPVPPASVDVELLSYSTYKARFPIEWSANPYANNTWRMYFQTLSWLSGYSADDANLDAAAAVLVDWVDHAMYRDPPLEYSWYDAGMARRLERVEAFIDRYIESRDVLSRRVVHAAAAVVATHLYALSSDICYNERSNHGIMQDVAILATATRHLALEDGRTMAARTERRLLDHVDRSVTSDGIHVENSPAYHVQYSSLVTDAIDALERAGREPPRKLTETRDRMLEALTYLLQPDLTFPQFGDTEDIDAGSLSSRLLARARAQSPQPNAADDRLEWVLTGGDSGTRPTQLDRVFERGGYASFRSSWLDSPEQAITAHFTCSRLSNTHYHKDETSFEIYGFGQRLIVDAGKFSYDESDPLVNYQYDVFAHNVLTIDGKSYQPRGTPRIVAHGSTGNVSWVRATHQNYANLGIRRQERTFVYQRPNRFDVVDRLWAVNTHDYEQHFHLDPSLSRVKRVGESYVATTDSGPGPTVVLTPGSRPTKSRTVRGLRAGGRVQGWQFPRWSRAEPAQDVIFRYRRRAGEIELPVVIEVFAPGEAPDYLSRTTLWDQP